LHFTNITLNFFFWSGFKGWGKIFKNRDKFEKTFSPPPPPPIKLLVKEMAGILG